MERSLVFLHWCFIGNVALAANPALSISPLSTDPAPPKSEKNLGDLSLEELMAMSVTTVTAQKREQHLMDVPISITALRGERLQNLGIRDIRDLRSQVPNVNVESSFGRAFPRFYIRGLGVDDFAINLVSPVELYHDEVLLESPILAGTPAFDLERLEVLRGPQGTLWGKNTTGGAIHFISKKPSAEAESYLRSTYGRFSERELEGAIGGPIAAGALSARGSFIAQSRDGWIHNRANGQHLEGYDDLAGRLQMQWKPKPQLSALLNLHGRTLDGDSTTFHFDLEHTARKREVALNQPNLLKETQHGLSLSLTYDFARVTLTSISAFEKGDWNSLFDIDGTDVVRLHERIKVNGINQRSQELRLASHGGERLDWIVGLHGFRNELDSFAALVFSPSFAERVDSVHRAESYAVFGHVDFAVNRRVTLSGGARWTHERKELTQSDRLYGPNLAGDGFDPNAAGAIPFGPGTAAGFQEKSWSQFTGDIALLYSVAPGANLYAKVARGFRAGAFDGLATTPNKIGVVDPEILTSFEGGLKATLLDGRLRCSVAGFLYDYKDNQFFFTTVGALFSRELRNAAGGTVYGGEVEADIAATDHLFLAAGLGYTRTRFSGPTIVQDPFDFRRAIDVGGNEFVRAPRLTSDLLARFTIPWRDTGEAYLQTDWTYTGSVFHDPTNNPRLRAPAYWQGGLRAGLKKVRNRWELAVWARNLTDADSFSNMFAIDGRVGGVFEGGPRTLGVEVIFRSGSSRPGSAPASEAGGASAGR